MKEIAKLFHNQCVGEHNGSMASIPNNPLFSSIFNSIEGRNDYKGFANKLRKIADQLEVLEDISF